MNHANLQNDLLFQNWKDKFIDLIRSAKREVILCAPYISMAGADCVRAAIQGTCPGLKCLVLTDLSPHNIASGSTDPEAIEAITQVLPESEVFHLPRLHAKVYIADRSRSVITSGNLTAGGLIRNFECGVSIEDGPKCAALGSQIENYSRLGAKILEQQIVACCTIARELKKLIKKDISTTRYSPEAMTKIEAIDEILITRRLAGRPVHGIFSETILYLLRQNGEMSTSSLHNLIEQIHPDLCDNRVDRVIDGKRFGKKWKHAVRTSQQHLKKNEEIHLNGQNWAISE